MIVKQIELQNFRNYDTLCLSLHGGINILYGDNAQGKTNILEAIYLCGTTKSHKGSKDKELIQLGENESHIRMKLEKGGIPHRIDMHLKKNKAKGVAIDGIPIRKSSELFGMLHIVFFSPEDLSMIKNGPAERRRFLDLELCQLNRLYLRYLADYNKALNQRNNLLKQIGLKRELLDTIDIWDSKLLEYGEQLIACRRSFIAQLNELLPHVHNKLSGGKESLLLKYEPNVEQESFAVRLREQRERDIVTKMTNCGPHRDDISFSINGEDAKRYGSQGQQRTAALSLKLAELELVRETIKEKPILLLDDVLSELDRKRQTQLLDSIQDLQTIITCTGLEEFVDDREKYNYIYHVINGTVKIGT